MSANISNSKDDLSESKVFMSLAEISAKRKNLTSRSGRDRFRRVLEGDAEVSDTEDKEKEEIVSSPQK